MTDTSQPDRRKRRPFDIVVVGAGYVGLATAVAIVSARPSLRSVIVDAAPPDVWKKDGRASAIAAAAGRMLEARHLGGDRARAQAITEMIVTDSRTSDPVRPVFLTFDGEVGPANPLPTWSPNKALNAALRRRAAELGIDILPGLRQPGLETHPGHARLHWPTAASIEARLVIACDGVRSRLRDMAGIRTVNWEYGQSGIVCTVAHERPHNGRAEEHFLPAGPFAILPLKGNRSSIVWTERTQDAERLVKEDPLSSSTSSNSASASSSAKSASRDRRAPGRSA
jgi:2-octaprenyl-6-methoxyphenol hydroxylase